jgi:caffeoyl-CoA O-methyltransferase
VTAIFRPQLILEIGTFTGYSALSMAAGLADVGLKPKEESGSSNPSAKADGNEETENIAVGFNRRMSDAKQTKGFSPTPQIHTIEVDDELEELARSFFERSPHGHKIHLHIGSALEVVPELFRELGRPFDMVFIDGDKREYPDYWRMLVGDGDDALKMVRSGSIILADNVLWYGKVADPDEIKSSDKMSQGIVEFNRLVVADSRVENVILPLRDGINFIRVK